MSSTIPDKSSVIVAVATFLIILPIVAIALRLASRRLSKAGIWWDDWVALVAWALSLGFNAILLYGVHNGWGKHIEDAPPDATVVQFQLLYAGEIIYSSCISLCKVSVLLFYYRLFGPSRVFRFALGAVGFLVIGWFLSMTLVGIFQCNPISNAWDPVTPGYCINAVAWFIGQATTNVTTDIILLLLPLPMLWKLQVTTPQKIALIGVFILGYLVPVVSVMRLVVTIQLGPKVHEDVTWNNDTLWMWSATELSIGVVSTCIPSTSYLFRRAVKSFCSLTGTARSAQVVSHRPGDSTAKKRSDISNASEFVRLQDFSVRTWEPDHTFKDEYKVSASRDNMNPSAREEAGADRAVCPPQQIHVRQDLDLTFEKRARGFDSKGDE